MTGNNPKLGLVNVDVYTKFGQIRLIHSQYIEWKPNMHGFTERRRHGMPEGQGESSIAPLFQSGAIKILAIYLLVPINQKSCNLVSCKLCVETIA